jgi:hypothetical protein
MTDTLTTAEYVAGLAAEEADVRLREVTARIRAGSDCNVCGDIGAINPDTGVGVPCESCEKVGPAGPVRSIDGDVCGWLFAYDLDGSVCFNVAVDPVPA